MTDKPDPPEGKTIKVIQEALEYITSSPEFRQAEYDAAIYGTGAVEVDWDEETQTVKFRRKAPSEPRPEGTQRPASFRGFPILTCPKAPDDEPKFKVVPPGQTHCPYCAEPIDSHVREDKNDQRGE